MEPEKDGLPAVQVPAEPANATDDQTPAVGQPNKPSDTLPDDPAIELARMKAENAEIVRQAKEVKDANAALEKRLRDNQEYISRTRNAEKATEPQRPQKTFEEYLAEVTKTFEDDPKKGLEKVVRDIAYDRDLERVEYEKRVALAEDRAFKKMLVLNPEQNKVLKEIEKLDEECPDLQGLSFERKVEFINLRNAGNRQQQAGIRDKVNREVEMAGDVGGSNGGAGRERIPAWLSDPESVAMLRDKFATKQEALMYADPIKAREHYERLVAKQRQAQLQ